MRRHGFPVLTTGLLAFGLTALPVQAHHEEGLHRGMANVRSIFLSVDGPDRKAINRENTSDLCLVALTHELQDEGFAVAGSRAKADAELVFTGGYITITQGRVNMIGDVQLNYAAVLKDKNGTTLWSVVDDEWGDSAAEACEDAADDIADELAEEREDALDD
ncbi:MAG: hypothetical protein ACRES4_10705 [Nevskiales bacterium]